MVKPQEKRCRFTIWTSEETSYTADMTATWEKTHVPSILSQHDLKYVFNADEFELFFNSQRKVGSRK